MTVHVLQHVAFEGLGSIEPWLAARGIKPGFTRFFANDPLPSVDDLDLVIAMGGPMSVNDEAALPWLRDEKRFIADAVAHGTPTLGVCLGAQLIASALGARVFQGPSKEIGWFPVQGVSAPEPAFRFPSECVAFHWHGETFDLPDGAVRLAGSRACAHQAFQLARHAIGLQCHFEVTVDGVGALVAHCRDELVPGPYVQSEEAIGRVSAGQVVAANRVMDAVLTYLLAAARGNEN
jgi:GMP synthase-like glutamine amidotransferase